MHHFFLDCGVPHPLALALVTLLLCWSAGAARADTCSVTMPDVDFGQVSPITMSDITVQSTGTISCTWNLTLAARVSACVTAGYGGTSTSANPRTMANGANQMQYNLYRASDYAAASIWGGAAVPGATTPFSFAFLAPAGIFGGTKTDTFTVYGKIPAGTSLATVPTVNNSNTVYSATFGGTLNYNFYGLGSPPDCMVSLSNSFSFTARATAINNCTITATPLNFGTPPLLDAVVRSTSTLSVQCVNGNGYQIALNGGLAPGTVAARRLTNAGTGEFINYRLSATLDGPLWGDGSAGTTVYSGTGTGLTVPIQVYGYVPVQSTPSPGTYKDTITATIYF